MALSFPSVEWVEEFKKTDQPERGLQKGRSYLDCWSCCFSHFSETGDWPE